MPDPLLSVIVIAYNMPRAIPRTIRSLSPVMQRDMRAEDYEIILIDNGSTRAFDPERCRQWGANLTIYHIADPTPSPVGAINMGLRMATGSLLGVLIDGARLASPGLLRGALTAAQLHPRPVIGTLSFHLGPDVQSNSVKKGYDEEQEDRILASVNWTDDGYRLFGISVFASSSAAGWFAPMAESNALFMPRPLWEELGGYDGRFQMPGGGLVNLDTWVRACSLSESRVMVLLGEGTFHQVHGGIATNAETNSWPVFHDEYQRIRGRPFVVPSRVPTYVGTVDPAVLPSIAWSAQRLAAPSSTWPPHS